MKVFHCDHCGNLLFFENTVCLACDRRVAFLPDLRVMGSLDPDSAERGIFDDFGYFFVTGTSQATPHVAALAALLYQQGITNPTAIKAAMEQTAEDLGASGRDDTFGNGLIRPSLALKGLGLNLK